MILLTGGVDGGDAATILHNAALLAQSSLAVPIVVAGNRAAAEKSSRIYCGAAARKSLCVANVMPHAGKLDVEPAREAIRQIFMARITQAKGLDGLAGIVPVVLPTPMAVLEGVRLGAEGAAAEAGWGDMLVVDVGGATTDVHSIGYGHAGGENVIVQSMAEAYAKRTVEGDLGIRYNAGTIFERVGAATLLEDLQRGFGHIAVTGAMLRDYVEKSAMIPARCRKPIGMAPRMQCWRAPRWISRLRAMSAGANGSSPAKARRGCITAKTCATRIR